MAGRRHRRLRLAAPRSARRGRRTPARHRRTEHLRPDEYAWLLTYRVEPLTHHAATIDVGRLSDGRAGELYAAEDPAHPRTWVELLFLRFATLSSSGLSDVVPIRALPRGLVRLDQLAGVGDVAMVVSRLTAMRVAYRRGP